MGERRDGGSGFGLDRREFLRAGALASAVIGLGPLASVAADTAETPRIRGTRTLGRTGLRVSDIGFGSSRLSGDEALVRHALERGIRYFDTAESYEGGRSEETLGRALAGHRDEIVLASKTSAEADSTRDALMRALEGSLRRLQTDRIDVYFNHAVNDVRRLQNPAWAEFVTRAKAAGKVRFTGMSGHGGRLVECLDFGIDHDVVDVVLVGYNFGQDPAFLQRLTRDFDFVAVQEDLPRVLAKARAKGVGVVAMKTLRGGKLNDMKPFERPGGTFPQAAFRWVLSSPNVDALVVTMRDPAQVDEYLAASGTASPSVADLRLLERYEMRNGREQCRYGCHECEDACPVGVPIADVLRTRMYAEDYGDVAFARSEYATLGAGAAACVSCAHRACTGACPHGLELPALTLRAHRAIRGS
jgi:predicted aldo/keto reductase-like oxidoreductase